MLSKIWAGDVSFHTNWRRLGCIACENRIRKIGRWFTTTLSVRSSSRISVMWAPRACSSSKMAMRHAAKVRPLCCKTGSNVIPSELILFTKMERSYASAVVCALAMPVSLYKKVAVALVATRTASSAADRALAATWAVAVWAARWAAIAAVARFSTASCSAALGAWAASRDAWAPSSR